MAPDMEHERQEEEALNDKICALVRDLPTPPLSYPLLTSVAPSKTTTSPGLFLSDSSKLSALIINSFQTNQLLKQVLHLLQSLLQRMGCPASLLTNQPTALATVIPPPTD